MSTLIGKTVKSLIQRCIEASEIYKINADRDLGERALFLDVVYLGAQDLARVHEAGEDDVVLFRYIADLAVLLVGYLYSIVEELLKMLLPSPKEQTRIAFFPI